MKVITSKENPIYRNAAKLLRKKYRDESGCYLLEGRKPLLDALKTGIMIEKVFVCNEKVDDLPEEIPDHLLIDLDRKLYRGLSDTETSQGIIAVVRRKAPDAAAFAELMGEGNLVVLDRLQDPGNAGTIIRTAEAAGFRGIVSIHGSVDLFSPKVVRSAAGSLFRMPVLTDQKTEDLIRRLHQAGSRIAVTAMKGSADFREADLSAPLALVIGNEGSGVGDTFLEAADVTVRIPMEGEIESLNASVAAGILMYRAADCNQYNVR